MKKDNFRSLPKSERDRIRKKQIVNAAARCVASLGFHKASLGRIAAEAGMSVGQIYRYFANKDAIIESIVFEMTEKHLNWMDHGEQFTDLTVIAAYTMGGFTGPPPLRGALLLEIYAEAARNPAVAGIVRKADASLREKATAATLALNANLNAEEVAAIVEYFATFSEGRLIRGENTPEGVQNGVMALHRRIVRLLLGGSLPEKS